MFDWLQRFFDSLNIADDEVDLFNAYPDDVPPVHEGDDRVHEGEVNAGTKNSPQRK